MIERQSVPQAVAEDGGRAAVVLGGAKDCDGVGAAGLIVTGVVTDFEVDMGHPEDGRDEESRECETEDPAAAARSGGGFAVMGWRLAGFGCHG